MNRDWVNELGHRTSKTPTCLLLKPDLSCDSFGYKAVERYAHLRDVYITWDKFLFFELFKIGLPDQQVRPVCTCLLEGGGSGVGRRVEGWDKARKVTVKYRL